jgi:hypothetical protein
MATIKLQNGKVVLKNGRVSCTCCEESECCLYPAQALREELYTVNDLPDTLIIVSGDFQQEMTKTGGFSPAYQGTNSEIFLTEITEGSPAFWDIFYNPGAGGDILSFGQSCLVDGVYVKDEFADTYYFSIPDWGIATQNNVLTRTSVGRWDGEIVIGGNTYPVELTLCGRPRLSDLNVLGWQINTIDAAIATPYEPITSQPEGFEYAYKARMKTPVGDYDFLDTGFSPVITEDPI